MTADQELEPATTPRKAITIASSAELSYVTSLANDFRNQIGFLPRAALAWYIEQHLCLLAYENGAAAGYVLGRPRFRWQPLMRPITHAAVQMDAQRRSHGLALVARVCDVAARSGQIAVQAMCRSDLDANSFWPAAGFVKIGSYDPISRDRQPVICWRRFLTNHRAPWLREMPPIRGWNNRSAAGQLRLFAETFGLPDAQSKTQNRRP